MEEWKEYKIGDICKIKHGFAFKGIHFVDEPQKYVCVTPGNFALKGGFKNDKPKYYNGPIPEDYVLYKDDLVVTMTDLSKNGDTLGYSALIPEDNNYIFLHNQRIGLIEDISQEIDKHFLYWIMRTYDYQRYIVGHCSGSTVKHTSPSGIGSYIFRCPDINTQREISSILDHFENKIAVNKKICENLEAQAQALFKHWFVDFAPFKDGKFVESELGLIPEGWRVGTIGDYCVIRSGFAFKSSWWQDEGVKVVKIKNITDSGTIDMSDCSCVSEEHASLASSFQTKSGDLLIAMTGATIGKFCVVHGHETYCVNQRVGKFFLGDNPLDKLPFIYCVLKKDVVYKEIVNKGQGSAQPNISGKDIEEIKIIFPPQRIIEQFNEELHSSFKLRINSELESSRLATLRDALLPKLMSGEIKVDDVK